MDPMNPTPETRAEIDGTTPLNQLVERHPATYPVLAAHGFDTCCGGSLPLEEAARHHHVSLPALLEELRGAIHGAGT